MCIIFLFLLNNCRLQREDLLFKPNLLKTFNGLKFFIYNTVHFAKPFSVNRVHVAKLLAPKATLVAFTSTSSTRLRPRSRSRIHVSVQETKKRGRRAVRTHDHEEVQRPAGMPVHRQRLSF